MKIFQPMTLSAIVARWDLEDSKDNEALLLEAEQEVFVDLSMEILDRHHAVAGWEDMTRKREVLPNHDIRVTVTWQPRDTTPLHLFGGALDGTDIPAEKYKDKKLPTLLRITHKMKDKGVEEIVLREYRRAGFSVLSASGRDDEEYQYYDEEGDIKTPVWLYEPAN